MKPSLFFALPMLALAAEQQIPLLDKVKSWFSAATSLIPSSIPIPTPAVLSHPLDAGAAKVTELLVHNLNNSNWKDVLEPAAPRLDGLASEWLVYVYGNDSCRGGCQNATKAWNMSTAILASSTNPPALASINCDSFSSAVLCSLWDVRPPSIYHLLFTSSTLPPTVRYIPLNQSSISASSLSAIHTAKTYELTEPYTGVYHPWSGLLATTGVGLPLAYFMWGMSKLPSWVPMVAISLASRYMFRGPGARRFPQGGEAPPAAAPAAAAPAPKN